MAPEETPTMKLVREAADPQKLIKNQRDEIDQIRRTFLQAVGVGGFVQSSSTVGLAETAIGMIQRLQAQQIDLARKHEAALDHQADLGRRLATAESKRAEAEKSLLEYKRSTIEHHEFNGRSVTPAGYSPFCLAILRDGRACRLASNDPIHARLSPVLPRPPHRLGLPDSPETVVDLPELPDAFIQAFLAALERFAEGYAEYGPGAADPLGLAGQWGDLHRKVMKLKRALWSGEGDEYLTRESTEEILQDIIGHSLLALEMLTRGFEGGRL